ncbi:pyridoxal phosphate-dependent transferase [Tricharina praecox]|uniref:pyridoxal phosphate-dependent transferase n=1 Tax=Tricharina praecox TaxID=43433 RepID=UPI00221EBD27|nr:pyridoxal phosphate-dependent transferase [Tricharina praecox]KAI5854980.1 pyridoxal phosphate-dependent transferase [Tricharina praecox]
MPTRAETCYFGAGPAALPTSVLETASASILNFENSGVGVIEQSHRSASSTNIISTACAHLASLLNVPRTYTVLWMQGGGTTQFSAVVYNLVGYWLAGAKAEYLVTGSWSKKAAEEAARLLGDEHVAIATDSRKARENKKFGHIAPEGSWTLQEMEKSIFSYYCDNETVDGVEFPAFPKALEGRLVACDMSSNILSRRVDVEKYGIIFAGAQKNVGGAGVTLVVVRNDILQKQPSVDTLRKLGMQIPPVMMHYPTLTTAGSLYNTLPIFEVYICREVMAGILERGGLEAQENASAEKANMLYDALDQGGIYRVVPEKTVRSRMNICFRIDGGEEVEKAFLKGAEAKGLTGLKGHRSVGGLRISNYNSIPKEAAEKLVGYINEFAQGRQ